MKYKSNKIKKLEKNRFSIIYDNLDSCCVCGSTYQISKNEIFEGRNRNNSMIYGMVAPMCPECHSKFHNDRSLSLLYKKMFEEKFIEDHTIEEFIEIFHINYL